MAEAIRGKATNGYSARLVAGFCWPWSNPDSSGQLVDDVKLDGFSMPWNAMPDAGKLAPGIPKSNFWASDPNGINQVGYVYTAQGFEFDYVGVIFGRDLVYDAGWRGGRKISHDSVVKKAPETEFVNLVKQTYRVLLTRGMKVCYVYFEDAATREFFLSRIRAKTASAMGARNSGSRVDDPWVMSPRGYHQVLLILLVFPHQTTRKLVGVRRFSTQVARWRNASASFTWAPKTCAARSSTSSA